MSEPTETSALSRVTEQVKRLLAKPITVGWLGAVIFLSAFGGLWLGISTRKQAEKRQSQGADLTLFVQEVTKQLERVETDRVAHGERALFRLKDFDLELSIIAKNSAKGTGEVKAEVITVGMGQELSNEVQQRIILHMELAPPETVIIEEAPAPLSPEGSERRPMGRSERETK